MNDIKIFEHEKFGKLEIYVDENKKEWFPATEIAEILGYKNPYISFSIEIACCGHTAKQVAHPVHSL